MEFNVYMNKPINIDNRKFIIVGMQPCQNGEFPYISIQDETEERGTVGIENLNKKIEYLNLLDKDKNIFLNFYRSSNFKSRLDSICSTHQ